MSKHRFRIFFRIFGCATESEEVIAATPAEAVRYLKECRAGKLVKVTKVKHIEEIINVRQDADNDQPNVIGNDNSRRYCKSL